MESKQIIAVNARGCYEHGIGVEGDKKDKYMSLTKLVLVDQILGIVL